MRQTTPTSPASRGRPSYRFMLLNLIKPEILDLLATGSFDTLREVLEETLPADLAALMQSLEPEEQVAVFTALTDELATDVFGYLDPGTQHDLISELPHARVVVILNAMAYDDRTALLEDLPPEKVTELLALVTIDKRRVARSLLSFPDDSVGRLMTPDCIAAEGDWTIRRVLDFIRLHGLKSETIDVIYVVDNDGRLIDDISIREFLVAPLDARVSDLMDEQFVFLKGTDDQESAVEAFRKYDRTVLPVVDDSNRLLGVVTVDDVLDVVEEEATEDIQKFGGVEALDEPYVSTPVTIMVRKRATWLIVLFLGEMLTASAMAFFEEEIARAVVLALFVPLIISSGGNSGSQAATLIIRALALGEITLRDWWRVMRREVVSGLLLGLILGAIGFLRIAAWSAFSDLYGPHWVLIGLTVAVTLVGIVLWGTLAGSMLPFVLKRFGLDPATSSAPFVATLVDVTGLVLYFSVALLLLGGKLL